MPLIWGTLMPLALITRERDDLEPRRHLAAQAGVALALLYLLGLGLALPATAEAQYFGRNKVQYDTFDFRILKTEHFDIYYYPEEEVIIREAARMAERWYARIARVLDWELSTIGDPLLDLGWLLATWPDPGDAGPGFRIGAACEGFGEELYERYKTWCDEYFYLKHRGETRGVGGLFFDDVNEAGFERSFEFLQSCGDSFMPAYRPIVRKRTDHPFGDRQRQFQLYRRGRYVEFNLIYDRGTIFGLQSGGRTESILMSLPPLVAWQYDWNPEPGSPEEILYRDYLRPRDWLAGQ